MSRPGSLLIAIVVLAVEGSGAVLLAPVTRRALAV
jgi:hypothetical protein